MPTYSLRIVVDEISDMGIAGDTILDIELERLDKPGNAVTLAQATRRLFDMSRRRAARRKKKEVR